MEYQDRINYLQIQRVELLSSALKDVINSALPDAKLSVSPECHVYTVNREVCYIKKTSRFVTLGFYGSNESDDAEIVGAAKSICYVNIKNEEDIRSDLFSVILKGLAYS